MAMKIRLARGGSKKRPFYRIVAADSRMPRDGRYVEKLGTYNPLLAKDSVDRVKMNQDGNKIIGYGAPAKATTALNFFGISKSIEFIVEDNNLKHGKIVPGVDIPIYSKSKIKDNKSTIIVMAWNFFNEIKKNNSNLSNKFINIKSLENNEIN